eukprot:CAMPEP_0185194332 /NCGR_PEP_ID=MMETSP1140-20130426/30435_1 /TAXON_ID=298111 /ORGANISM="Pavlova sp., Strain CCMP459" /LENGTH=47 /DNA_ID= /DNA_START= /DNA_END= /DNA_ORIENTATION=
MYVARMTPLPPLSRESTSSGLKVDMPTDLMRCCSSRWMPLHVVHAKT